MLAIPTVKGEKSPSERFAGALNTYTIEALMQNGLSVHINMLTIVNIVWYIYTRTYIHTVLLVRKPHKSISYIDNHDQNHSKNEYC